MRVFGGGRKHGCMMMGEGEALGYGRREEKGESTTGKGGRRGACGYMSR